MESPRGDDRPHLPGPSLWPVGFAVGIACVLVGLIVSWPAVAVGAAITAVFGFLWVRDVTTEQRRVPEPEHEPQEAPPPSGPVEPRPAHEGEPALPRMEEAEIDRFPRSKFLEGATLGIGAAIGGIVTVPVLGFAVAPAFVGQEAEEVDIGPVSAFPEGEWRIATFLREPEAGEVSRRTAYVRNNGTVRNLQSFTIVSNRCVHLGCPVQPSGPVNEDRAQTIEGRDGAQVRLIPTEPSAFTCPCHGGAYDAEGNRTQGPPVRALDRYEYLIRNGRLVLGKTYSVGDVEGSGANARIKRYKLVDPGVHVDGIEAWLYPLPAPNL